MQKKSENGHKMFKKLFNRFFLFRLNYCFNSVFSPILSWLYYSQKSRISESVWKCCGGTSLGLWVTTWVFQCVFPWYPGHRVIPGSPIHLCSLWNCHFTPNTSREKCLGLRENYEKVKAVEDYFWFTSFRIVSDIPFLYEIVTSRMFLSLTGPNF